MTTELRFSTWTRKYSGMLVALLLLAAVARAQLTALGSAQLDQCGGPDACEDEDRFGSTVAVGDFDHDGFADLAVGVPGETTAGVAGGGMVEVFYGSRAGLPASADAQFTQETSGISGSSETDDHFGAALSAGDLDRDGFDDLAIGVPDEDIGGTVDAGVIYVLFGSAVGLSGAGSVEYDQSNLPPRDTSCFGDVRESPEVGDQFGFSVAFGLPPVSGLARKLLVGTPGESGSGPGQAQAGQVTVLTFTDFVGEPRGESCNRFQNAIGTCTGTDGAESGDRLGRAVCGRLRAASDPDEAFGVPFEETASGVTDSGAAMVGDQCLQQNGALSGGEGNNDQYGGAFASGDYDDNGFQDLAIGVAGDTVGSTLDAGAVSVVFADNADRISVEGDQIFDQSDFPAVFPGAHFHFAAALASGDYDGDGRDDLAIGAPDSTISGHVRAGLIDVLYSQGADGLTAAGSQTFDQDLPASIPGVVNVNDAFGGALAAGDFDGNGTADLAIGVPGENVGATDGGVVDLLYGLDRATGAFGDVSFAIDTVSVNEGAGSFFLIVHRNGGAVVAATVTHFRAGGTATLGLDFDYTPGAFNWTAGDISTETKAIEIVEDSTDEPNETLVLQLLHPSDGLALGAHSTLTLTIVDNDPPGQLFVDGFETGNTTKWSAAVP